MIDPTENIEFYCTAEIEKRFLGVDSVFVFLSPTYFLVANPLPLCFQIEGYNLRWKL